MIPADEATSTDESPSADELSAPRREVRALEGLLEATYDDFEGTPVAWPSDLPEALTPVGFERRVRTAVAACLPEAEIVGFHCDEPPCLVAFRPVPVCTRAS